MFRYMGGEREGEGYRTDLRNEGSFLKRYDRRGESVDIVGVGFGH
jgi:hypothetical protein